MFIWFLYNTPVLLESIDRTPHPIAALKQKRPITFLPGNQTFFLLLSLIEVPFLSDTHFCAAIIG
jgi:hypothetical protein